MGDPIIVPDADPTRSGWVIIVSNLELSSLSSATALCLSVSACNFTKFIWPSASSLAAVLKFCLWPHVVFGQPLGLVSSLLLKLFKTLLCLLMSLFLSHLKHLFLLTELLQLLIHLFLHTFGDCFLLVA